LKSRRILVVRKERNSSPEQDTITETAQSQRKGLKKSLHLRLGGKVDGYSESEIYMEMLKDNKKLSKKLKKEKPSARIVRAKGHSDLESEEDLGKRLKSKRRSSNEGSLDGESADLLERMRRKNEKRLKRMREIEQDKLMFA